MYINVNLCDAFKFLNLKEMKNTKIDLVSIMH